MSDIKQPDRTGEALLFLLKNLVLYILLINLIIFVVVLGVSFIIWDVSLITVYYKTLFWLLFRLSLLFSLFLIIMGLWLIPTPP